MAFERSRELALEMGWERGAVLNDVYLGYLKAKRGNEDEGLAQMKEAGVELVACKACADSYGVSDKLEELGVEVKYMGQPLTAMLKGDWVVATF